mgnify:CR=1 FL=1
MKISQRDLELKILKCVTTIDNAIDIASEKMLAEHHFLTKEPGVKISCTGKLYSMCVEYAQKSGGSKLTEDVMESMLTKKGVPADGINKFLNLWYEIDQIDTNLDEFSYFLSLMKDRYCIKLISEMTSKNTEYVTNDQIKEAISSIRDYVNIMTEEQDEFLSSKVTFDMSKAGEFFIDEYEKRLLNPDMYKGITCGLKQIDDKTLGWRPAQLITLLAPTGGGKSVQMLNFAQHAHSVCKQNVLYFSFEMDDWLCELRHVSMASGIEYSKLKRQTINLDYDLKKLNETFDQLDNGSYFIYFISMDDPTAEYVEQKIREYSSSHGKPGLVVVDYIGNMTTRTTNKNAKPWEKNGDAAEALFKIAKRYNIPIVTAQQINRDAIRENRKNKEAGKAAAYYQDAASGDQRLMHLSTYVIGVEPDKDQNLVYYHPVKMRDCHFDSFAAKLDITNNRLIELTDSQQMALQDVRSADTSAQFEKPKNTQQVEIEEVDLSGWDLDF